MAAKQLEIILRGPMYLSLKSLYIYLIINQLTKIKPMKISTKKLLVNYIIANGNPGITRTELIKAILHLKFGGKVKYDRELYRGYYSGPISGINNYLMNGPAECGLVKSNGRYYAQYFTIEERKKRTLNLYYHKCDIYSTRCWSEAYTNKFLEAALRSYNRAMKKLEKESAS